MLHTAHFRVGALCVPIVRAPHLVRPSRYYSKPLTEFKIEGETHGETEPIITSQDISDSLKPFILPILSCRERSFNGLFNGDFSQINLERKRPQTKPIEFKTGEISDLLKEGRRLEVYQKVLRDFQAHVYLSPTDFGNLIPNLGRSLGYKLAELYSAKYDLTAFNNSLMTKMASLAYQNKDFKLFGQLFQALEAVDAVHPYTLSMALELYLENDVSFATQLFNQSVLSEEATLPAFLLHKYLQNLRRVTRNAGLCYSAYRLWVSHSFATWPKTDAFMLEYLRSVGTEEQKEWISASLAKRGRSDDPQIRWLGLMQELRDPVRLNAFYREEYSHWQRVLGRELDSFLLSEFNTKLFDLDLSQGRYERVRTALIGCDRSVLFTRLRKLLRHLENWRETEACFRLLREMSRGGLEISNLCVRSLWSTLVKRYPQFAQETTEKFVGFVKEDATFAMEPLLQELKVKVDKRGFGFPLSEARLGISAIEENLRSGINPSQIQLTRALERCRNADEFNRVSAIAHTLHAETYLGYRIESFWKQRELHLKATKVDEFLRSTLVNIDALRGVSMRNMTALLVMSGEFEHFDLGDRVLRLMIVRRLRPGPCIEAQKLAYALIEYLFKRKDFAGIVRVLERVRRDRHLGPNPFFVASLARLNDRFQEKADLHTEVNNLFVRHYSDVLKELEKIYEEERVEVARRVDEMVAFLREWRA